MPCLNVFRLFKFIYSNVEITHIFADSINAKTNSDCLQVLLLFILHKHISKSTSHDSRTSEQINKMYLAIFDENQSHIAK